MRTTAVVFEAPQRLALAPVGLEPPSDGDVVVDVEWSGISTGTEKLLWTGQMPPFPGMGYPLVPGYESVGRVRAASTDGRLPAGQRVFVPGARCFSEVRGLFGGAAKQLVVPAERVIPIDAALEERGILLALAATAQHALGPDPDRLPELIIGHGVLGRLLARLTVAAGGKPVVWETNPARAGGAQGYTVIAPDPECRRHFRVICDASGDPRLLDTLVLRLAKGGEIVLAGFYSERLSFDFAPAFMREATLRIAAEFREPDLARVKTLVRAGKLSLDGLITHRVAVSDADHAYRTAFGDPACLKMVLDWRQHA